MIDGIFGMNRSWEILEEKAAEIEGRTQYATPSRLRDYLDSTQGLLMYHMGMTDVIDVEPRPSASDGGGAALSLIPHLPS